MDRTISVDNTSLVFPANWEAGDILNQDKFTVLIDGKSNGGGFRYETSNDDWFDVVLTDNTFTVTVKENFDITERNGYIIIHHNKIIGDAGEVVVDIKQNGIECEIQANPSEKEFKSLNFEKEEVNIDVSVIGGDKKFFIKSFKEYKVDEVVTDGEVTKKTNKVIQNDRGIKIDKIGEDKLRISSYGRVFKENGHFYEIVLAHNNDARKTATIKVTYDDKMDIAKTDVPSLSTTIPLRKVTKSTTRNVLTVENNTIEESENMGAYLKIYGLNEPIIELTKRGRKKTIKPSEEIIFEHNGGVKEYDFDVSPKHTYVTVKMSCEFVKYKINNNKLTLEALPSKEIYDRYGFIKIKNASDPFVFVYKKIVQKGESSK